MPLEYEPWYEAELEPDDRRARILRLLLLAAIMRLVFRTARLDTVDVEEWYARLLRIAQDAYDAELALQAANIGCPGRIGHLTNAAILDALRQQCAEWAASIVNTYNYYLGAAIVNIHGEFPDATRALYATRLGAWEERYWSWKLPQITEHTANWARAKAQQDFYSRNAIERGTAVMYPLRAVCPVCQGWIARGEVPLRVALNNPPPYHPNCFPPGTQVMLADNTQAPIEDVAKGDQVLSSKGNCRVVKAFERPTEEALYRLSVGDRVLRATGDHPVKTRRGWIPARDLRVGDEVLVLNRERPIDDTSYRE